MENSKKVMLALGLALSVVGGGLSNNVQAMEQERCNVSMEITKLHKLVSEEMKSLSTLAGFRLGNSPVVNPDFLKTKPLDMLYHLQYAVDWLNIQLKQTQKTGNLSEGQAPGTMSFHFMKMHEQDLSVLRKVQRLLDLIKKTCGITDQQISEIRNKLNKSWTEEFESRGQEPFEGI